MADEGFLFARDGDWFVRSVITNGPWRPDAIHGGPPCALVARSIEAELEPDELVARIGVDLERPVPREPLLVKAERRKVSRRVAHVNVQLWSATAHIASARGVLLRGTSIAPGDDGRGVPALPGPESASVPPAGVTTQRCPFTNTLSSFDR